MTVAASAAQSCMSVSCLMSPLRCWQIVTIVITEYGIQFPEVMDSISSAFSWCNFGLFSLFQQGCKVSGVVVLGTVWSCG
jgi:hypothetical protein